MNDAAILDRASKAKAILESEVYQEAWGAVRQRLVDLTFSVDTKDDELAGVARQSVKILDALKVELDHAIQSGKLAAHRLDEIEARRRNPLRGIFR